MKRNKTTRFIKILSIGILLVASGQSCTKLNEDVYSQVTQNNFFRSNDEYVSAVGAAYTSLYGLMGNSNVFPLQEVTSDEMIVPIRNGNEWEDGNNWRRLKEQTYTPEDDRIRDGWNFCYGGVNNCNRLIYQLQSSNSVGAGAYISELRSLRGLFYYWLLDLYGNVPLVTKFDVPNNFSPANNTRKEVYDFVETDLRANMDSLSKAVDVSTYGRVNYYTAQAILAKIYLNAEVYTGTPQWQKVIAACDTIINSGKYNLATDYFDNFKTNNSGSSEFIFAIPYDRIYARGFNMTLLTLHYGSQDTYNLTVQPWNGFCTVQEFYNSYADNDVRKKSFIEGPQYKSNGERVTDPAAEATDPDGPPLTYTPDLPGGFKTLRQAGARVGKWEFEKGAGGDLSNDFAIFRYADILLMKAEALWRLYPGDAQALALVTQVRARANMTALTALSADSLLAERGRELFSEAYRRQDQIRFGTYNKASVYKPATDTHVNIFPIPKAQLDANKSLKQNPGY